MERINELLERLTELSEAELAELNGLLAEQYSAIDTSDAPATAEQIATMGKLVTGLEAVAEENQNRQAQAAARDTEAAALRERADALLNPPEAPEAEITVPDPTAEAPEAPEGNDPADPAAEAGAETTVDVDGSPLIPEPVLASGAPRGTSDPGIVGRMNAATVRATPSPTQPEPQIGTTLLAAGGLSGIGFGTPFETGEQLGAVMADQIGRLGGRGDYHHESIVASATWANAYPEERRLRGSDVDGNSRKINAICGLTASRFAQMDPQTVVATGGICLPVNVDYAVPTWSTADRPLLEGLPAYQASRGGVRFVTPPDIGVPPIAGTASGAGLSTGLWTEATDASPGGATKPVWVVACGTENVVYVEAVTTRVQFGNMQSRFAPEQIAANTEQAIAVSAREAELNLLTLMLSASFVKQVTIGTAYLGALRDVLTALDLSKAQYCDSHRIPRNTAFTAVFPAWAKDMFKADLVREAAHDNAGPRDVLAVTDAQIDGLFAARGVNVIWTLEGVKAATYGNVTVSTTQQFAVFTTGNTPQWPGQSSSAAFQLTWLLYIEGTYQFLDGGRLDLGVVRDSLLDSTNDYETFVETFEGVAGRGIDAYAVTQTLLPNGASAGTAALSGYKE